MHGIAADSYCGQYSHKCGKRYFIQCFSLVDVSHQQKQKHNTQWSLLRNIRTPFMDVTFMFYLMMTFD